MPNGISCAFFAGKNIIYGKKENNIFKEGIGGAQTARTIDSAAQAGLIKVPCASGISKAAKIAKKIVYPLIIMSGIYNTIKAEDKVKTGFNQAGGITTMCLFEMAAEKGLNSIERKLINSNIIKNNKLLGIGLYAIKGLAFVTASLCGYSIGSKTADKAVDKIRMKHSSNTDNKKEETADLQETNIFENMELT